MPQRIIINDPVAEALNRLSDQVVGQAVSSLNRLRDEKRSDARYEEQKAYRDQQSLANDSLRELSLIAGQLNDESLGYEIDQIYNRVSKVKTNGNPMVDSLKAVYLDSIDAHRTIDDVISAEGGTIYETLDRLEKTLDPVDKDGQLHGNIGLDAKAISEEMKRLEYAVNVRAKKFKGNMYQLLQSRMDKIQTLAGISENLHTLDADLNSVGVQYGADDLDQGIADIGLENVTSALVQGDYQSAGKMLQNLATFVSAARSSVDKAQTKELESRNEDDVKAQVSKVRAMYASLADLSAQLGPENIKARAIFNAPKSIGVNEQNFFAMQIQLANQIGNILGHGNVDFGSLKKIGETVTRDGKKLSPYTEALNAYKRDRSTANALTLANALYEISKDENFASVLNQSPGFDKDFLNVRQGTEKAVARTYLQRLVEGYGYAKSFSPGGKLEVNQGGNRPSTYDVFKNAIDNMDEDAMNKLIEEQLKASKKN